MGCTRAINYSFSFGSLDWQGTVAGASWHDAKWHPSPPPHYSLPHPLIPSACSFTNCHNTTRAHPTLTLFLGLFHPKDTHSLTHHQLLLPSTAFPSHHPVTVRCSWKFVQSGSLVWWNLTIWRYRQIYKRKIETKQDQRREESGGGRRPGGKSVWVFVAKFNQPFTDLI